MKRGLADVYTGIAVAAVALISSVSLLWRSGASVSTIALAALPPSLLLGFISLASRYLCRAMP